MSRLDSVIRRLQAQRACLDMASGLIADVPGVVFELGLGNGRTYDHIREVMPEREIFVFERQVAAHPDCIPDDDHLFLGDFSDSVPANAGRFAGAVALVHGDIGSGRADIDAQTTALLDRHIPAVLAPGAVLAFDQDMKLSGCERLPLPEGVKEGRYFLYRKPT